MDHQMRLLMCPRTSLQYVGKVMNSWMQFPPLLVNNQFNRWNVIVIVKNGEWILDNQTSQTNMICPWGELIVRIKIYWRIWLTQRTPTKKWWWPLFQFALNVAVNNAYQIYCQPHLYPGEYRLDALDFCRPSVDANYCLYKESTAVYNTIHR